MTKVTFYIDKVESCIVSMLFISKVDMFSTDSPLSKKNDKEFFEKNLSQRMGLLPLVLNWYFR